MKVRRSLLFMPGDDRRKIEKGAGLNVDAVIMDLEDGVALNRKQAAREVTVAALKELDFGRTERLVRINPVSDTSELWREDIQGTIQAHPDGYVIPKVERMSHLQKVDYYLTRTERENGWEENGIPIIAIIESARGVINLRKIVRKTKRLVALAFGAEDLAGDIGATRTPDGWEVFYAKSAVVTHAKAYGLQAIDTPFVDLTTDNSNLIAETERALYMGYTGKFAIHPKQVDIIQKVFMPTDEQIEKAQTLIDAHNEHQAAGSGVFVWEGRMVDMPMIRAAESVLARAEVDK